MKNTFIMFCIDIFSTFDELFKKILTISFLKIKSYLVTLLILSS